MHVQTLHAPRNRTSSCPRKRVWRQSMRGPLRPTSPPRAPIQPGAPSYACTDTNLDTHTHEARCHPSSIYTSLHFPTIIFHLTIQHAEVAAWTATCLLSRLTCYVQMPSASPRLTNTLPPQPANGSAALYSFVRPSIRPSAAVYTLVGHKWHRPYSSRDGVPHASP